MPRPKRGNCQNCRRLRIQCDLVRPSCEYCISTRRRCVYESVGAKVAKPSTSSAGGTPRLGVLSPSPRFASELTRCIYSTQFNLTGLEMSLVDQFRRTRNFSGDDKHAMFGRILFEEFPRSKNVRMGVVAYMGLIIVNNNNPELLCGAAKDSDPPPGIVAIFKHSIVKFNYIVNLVHQLLVKVASGEASQRDFTDFLISHTFLLSALWALPFLKIVDFDHSGNDFLSIIIGARHTLTTVFVSNQYSPILKWCLGIVEEYGGDTDISPWYRPYIDYIDHQSDENAAMYSSVFRALNHSWYRGCVTKFEVAVSRVLFFVESKFFKLVYDKDFLALTVLNLFVAQAELLGFETNHPGRISYMEFYRQYNFDEFGRWFFEQDAHLYSVLIQKKFKRRTFEGLFEFDPTVLDSMI